MSNEIQIPEIGVRGVTLDNHHLEIRPPYDETMLQKVGIKLSEFKEGLSWAWGDWYLAYVEKYGTARARLFMQERDWDVRYVERNALICKEFPCAYRIRNLGFNHYNLLYNKDLTPEKRAELIQRASKGTDGKPWTIKETRKQVKVAVALLTDTPVKVPKSKADDQDFIDKVISEITKGLGRNTEKKIAHKLRDAVSMIAADARQQVQDAVELRTEEQRQRLREKEKEVEQQQAHIGDVQTPIVFYMTEDEYKLVLSCLHPDKQPEDLRIKYTKATQIFMRLRNMVPKHIPAARLRKAGWE